MKKSKSSQIRTLLRKGESPTQIAQRLGISRQLVYVVKSKDKLKNKNAIKFYHADKAKKNIEWAVTKQEGKSIKFDHEDAAKPDMVNHPPHYTQGRYEVIDVLEEFASDDPLIWQVLKYTLRYKHKGAAKEDLMKARWYLDRKIGGME